jgi:excisionase family DNA binding protein
MVYGIQTVSMLTTKEASKLLHIHPNTLKRWSDKGIIKAYRITQRGDRRFKQQDIINCLAILNSHNGDEREISSAYR